MSPSLAVLPRPAARDRAVTPRHVLVSQGIGSADRIAAALTAALADPDADAVLLVDAGAVLAPDAMSRAIELIHADDAVDVVAWRAAGDPAACAAALLPLDAVRAVGLAHAGLTRAALADLVLRAHGSGFRTAEADIDLRSVAGPTARDRVLLAMLHEPVAARNRVVRASLAAEVRALLGRRSTELAARHRDLAAVLVAPAADERSALLAGGAATVAGGVLRQAWTLHVRLWLGWGGLRRTVRAAAFEQASPEAWARRSAQPGEAMDDTRTDGERGRARRGPVDVRWRPWSTTRRGTSAA